MRYVIIVIDTYENSEVTDTWGKRIQYFRSRTAVQRCGEVSDVDCDERILKYAADYHVNLIVPSQLSDEEINEFQTNFREVMMYMKYSKDKEKLKEVIQGDGRFQDLERQAADVISAVTGAKIKYSGKEDKVDMCKRIQTFGFQNTYKLL